jgi:cell division protein FtsW
MQLAEHIDERWLSFKGWLDHNLKGDLVIWLVAVFMSIISVAAVYSASGNIAIRYREGDTEYYLLRHVAHVAAGLFFMWLTHKLDYRYFSRLSRITLIFSFILLVLTMVYGVKTNEASRWLNIPIINQSFQPSDLAKIALIAYLAAILAKRQNNIKTIKEVWWQLAIPIAAVCGATVYSNFSTAGIIYLSCVLLLFFGRVPIKYIVLMTLVLAMLAAPALIFGQRGSTVISRVERFVKGNDPAKLTKKDREKNMQKDHAITAVVNGGLFGKGPGNSEQKTFLPHPYSDFVYAIIIEEYGMIGGVFVLILYLLLLYRGTYAVANSKNSFGGLLSSGISFLLFIQALVHMAVTVDLLPSTGQPLPFISMGGTSFALTGISIGIILSVSRGEQILIQKEKTSKAYVVGR